MHRRLCTRVFLTPLLMWALTFICLGLASLRLHPKQITYDGVFYFIQLRSAYFDRDLDFRNEAEHSTWVTMSFGTPLPDHRLADPFAVGSAILWAPFYGLADGYCHVHNLLFTNQYDCNGYIASYVKAVIVGTVFWSATGILLLIYAIKRLGGRLWLAGMTTTALVLSSPLIFYVVFQADYAHGNSFFTIALLLYCTLAAQDSQRQRLADALTGCAVGLAFLVRWQDLIFGLLPAMFIIASMGGASGRAMLRAKLSRLAVLAGSATVVALPQLLVWQNLYGHLLVVPQGAGFLSFAHIAPLEFLFSTWNGAFLWHPVFLLAALGFVIAPTRFYRNWPHNGRVLYWTCLILVGGEFLLSMMAQDWWAGGSFGQRRLISTLPLLGLGLYHIVSIALEVTTRRVIALAVGGLLVVLISLNGLTLLRYYQKKLPFDPANPVWYASGRVYGHFDFVRRFGDLLGGRNP